MNNQIKAVFLDIGNTLRILLKDEPHQAAARRKLVELAGAQADPESFTAMIDARYKQYRKWAFENLAEAPEPEMWTRFLLPEFPPERIAPLGVELTYQYRQSMGRRVVTPGAREVLDELERRGYVLGIISNVITSREIPDWLEQDNYGHYFKSVVLSSVFGRRKPHPSIYLEAARQAEVEPAACAYVGDNLKRDVTGTRAAGFGMVVILIDPQELAEEPPGPENTPDVIIHRFSDLLTVFHDTTAHLPGAGA